MTTASLKKEIEVHQYCDTVYRELSEMKKKVFDIVCGVETTSAEEERRRAQYFDLFQLIDYIEKKLESLSKECPPDWKGARTEIEGGRRKLGDAVNWWYG